MTQLAIARLGNYVGMGIGVAYGLSWGIAQAAAFDFPEIAFAVPLLVFSLVALASPICPSGSSVLPARTRTQLAPRRQSRR